MVSYSKLCLLVTLIDKQISFSGEHKNSSVLMLFQTNLYLLLPQCHIADMADVTAGIHTQSGLLQHTSY